MENNLCLYNCTGARLYFAPHLSEAYGVRIYLLCTDCSVVLSPSQEERISMEVRRVHRAVIGYNPDALLAFAPDKTTVNHLFSAFFREPDVSLFGLTAAAPGKSSDNLWPPHPEEEGHVEYYAVSDADARSAQAQILQLEGIHTDLDSARTAAFAGKLSEIANPDNTLILCISAGLPEEKS